MAYGILIVFGTFLVAFAIAFTGAGEVQRENRKKTYRDYDAQYKSYGKRKIS